MRAWLEQRLPLVGWLRRHVVQYSVPKNLNLWYVFGVLALVVFVMQIVTGFFLVMHYQPNTAQAFASIDHIMREVPFGWLIRYMHSTGASLFFVVVYLHMFKGMLYGSYRKPRELVWLIGVLIFLCLMAEAFFGYLLPWGQMSYWGAQVILNLLEVVPVVGEGAAMLLRGGAVVGDATLGRFFAFHVILLPLLLLLLVAAHIAALHQVGSNNPEGIDIYAVRDSNGWPLDAVPFHPFYTVKDAVAVVAFLLVFALIVFFAPTFWGYFLEAANFSPADPLVTPEHIRPVWYFTPFYAMLRATTDPFKWALIGLGTVVVLALLCSKKTTVVRQKIGVYAFFAISFLLRVLEAKFWGLVVLATAVLILAALPWLDRSPVNSIRYRPRWQRVLYICFAINFVVLGVVGMQSPSPALNVVAQLATLAYLAFFFLMPFWSGVGRFKPVPARLPSSGKKVR